MDGVVKLTGGGMMHMKPIKATSDRGQWKSVVVDIPEDVAQHDLTFLERHRQPTSGALSHTK